MNYEELISALKAHYESQKEDERDYEDGISEFAYSSSCDNVTDEIGEMKEVEQHGGEGEGENWWSVKYFPKHDIYVKISGYYASYDGTSFDGWEDDCKQVKPIEKTVTVYE